MIFAITFLLECLLFYIEAVSTDLKRRGLGKVDHRPPISEDDLRSLNSGDTPVFNTETPYGLQRKVWFELTFFLCRRGRENLRTMKKDTFRLGTDDTGRKFIYQFTDDFDINHSLNTQEAVTEGRMYELQGSYTGIYESKYKAPPNTVTTNFSTSTIWVDSAGTLGYCALKCHVDTNCNSFGYNSITKICQGHRQCFLTKDSNPYITTTAAIYFALNDGKCARDVSEETIYWRVCNPSIPFHKPIGQPLTGRKIVIEGILKTVGNFAVNFYSDLSNYGFNLQFDLSTYQKTVKTAIKINTVWKDGIVHYQGTGGPAIDSLFCLEVLVTTETYKVIFNNEYMLERNVTNNFEIYDKLVIYATNSFILYEVSVIVS